MCSIVLTCLNKQKICLLLWVLRVISQTLLGKAWKQPDHSKSSMTEIPFAVVNEMNT